MQRIKLTHRSHQGEEFASFTLMRNPGAGTTTIRYHTWNGDETHFLSLTSEEREKMVETLIEFMELDGDLG